MWLKNVQYLDYNAGSGLSELVHQKLVSLLKDEGEGGLFLANPSSRHRLGQRVGHHLYQAKSSVAKSLGDRIATDDLFFTSSGTESNQTVIRSAVELGIEAFFIGSIEHSATAELLPWLEKKCPLVRVVPVLPQGQYDLAALAALLDEAKGLGLKSAFVSLAWVNHETGVIQDIPRLGEVLQAANLATTLHLDAAQAWGKVPLNLESSPADYVTLSAHKIGALAGTGIVWCRKGALVHPLIVGSQQSGLRGGTENSLGIIAAGIAASELNPVEFQFKTSRLRDHLESFLLQCNVPVRIWGVESPRVGNTSRLGLLGFQRYENWVELLDLRGFAVSHASACKSQVIEPSGILLAMGATKMEALNSIRVSVGPQNTIEEMDQFGDTLRTLMQLKMGTSESIAARPKSSRKRSIENQI